MILETKGYDPLRDVKRQAADRWTAAVNADGAFGHWTYKVVDSVDAVTTALDQVSCGLSHV